MLRAGVPLLQAFDIVARGHSNARFSRLMMDIKGRIEVGLEPVAGVSRAPGPVRPLYCNLVSAGRDLRHARRDPRPPRDLQGKDPRHQGQDQVGAVLPDLGHHRRDRRGLGHHGLGHPGVQAGVHELRRRPADADADRDGHFRFLRHVVVADGHDRRRRDLQLLRAAATLDGVPLHGRPREPQDTRHRPDSREGHGRALDADALDDVRRRRAAGRVARRRGGSVGQCGLCARAPSASRPRSAPARA